MNGVGGRKMKTWLIVALLAVMVAGRVAAEEIELVEVGKSFVTTEKLKEGDEVRIRVKKMGDGLGDMIFVSQFSPSQVRFMFESTKGLSLKEWAKNDIEEGQVLIYTVEEPAHVGVGMGNTYTRNKAQRKGDHFEMTFSSVLHTWVLEVKFAKPEF
jgi:hypothetical protein